MPNLDTLVFRYQEYAQQDVEQISSEKRLCTLDVFVLYDYEHNYAAMYGVSTKEYPIHTDAYEAEPFHFLFHRLTDAHDFLRCLSGKLEPCDTSLYALKDVPILMEDISYSVLADLADSSTPLIAHYEPYLNETQFKSMLGFVQKAFTLYEYSDDVCLK